jgi:hypothetical protein
MCSLSMRALQEVEILSSLRSTEVICMSLLVPRRSSESFHPQFALQQCDHINYASRGGGAANRSRIYLHLHFLLSHS